MLKVKLTKEEETQFINDIIAYFQEERNEVIGIIQAHNYLDFFLETIGNSLYNKGVDSSKSLLELKVDEILFNLEELKK